MKYDRAIRMLESQWEPENGFLWKLRQGQFIEEEYLSFCDELSSLSIAEDENIPVRLVSLLWYVPLFMDWQKQRVEECGGDRDDYSKAVSSITNEVERLLGVP
jgi:hypothetical protein